MNYEKKYKEALERAKNLKEMYPQDAAGYEEVFPELREPEDERIRNWLITQLRNNYKGNYWATQALSWLEKQKEATDFGELMNKLSAKEQQVMFDAWEYNEKIALKKQKDSTVGSFSCSDEKPSQLDVLRAHEATSKLLDKWRKEDKQEEQPLLSSDQYDWEIVEQKPNYCHYGGDPSEGRCKYCSAVCSVRIAEEQKSIFPEKLGEVHWNPISVQKEQKPVEIDEEYKVGTYFKGLIPCWIDAPSTLQPAHKYHGMNVIAIHEKGGGFRCCCVDEEKPVTFHLPEGTHLVEGWKRKPVEWRDDYREEDIQTRFAFYTYKDDPSVLYLSNVFVEEASRNHGFGTRILRAAEKVAETIGATTISLKVKQDSPANAWYRKNGYGYVAFEDGYDWLEKNLEYMKPNKQEWSDEDEKIITALTKALIGSDSAEKIMLFDGVTIEMVSDWLKSLRPIKTEWSEEDKEIFNNIIEKAKGGHWIEVNEITWLINRFKSFRPQQKQKLNFSGFVDKVGSWFANLKLDHYRKTFDGDVYPATLLVQKYDSFVNKLSEEYNEKALQWKPSEEQEEPEYYQHFDPDC